MGCGGAATRGLTPAKVGGGLWHHEGGSLPRPHGDLRSAAGDRSSGNGRRSRGRRRGDRLRPERGQVPLEKEASGDVGSDSEKARLRAPAQRGGRGWERLRCGLDGGIRRLASSGKEGEAASAGAVRSQGQSTQVATEGGARNAREQTTDTGNLRCGPLRLGGVRVGRLRVRGSACICPHYS